MSKAKAPRVFVPLTKVDEEQRLVYGTITQEVLDKSGEVMDYDTSKPNFEKWSNEIHAASGGLSKGNLRVMHGLTVAGKLTDLSFNDDDKSIEVCSKVVDDSEWNKVLEGCYTGFSVGGKYGKKWSDTVDGQTIKKYEAIPNEVSLVDNPCVPSATFSLVKADGAEEQIMFKVPSDNDEVLGEQLKKLAKDAPPEDGISNEAVATKATELAKAAGNGSSWIDHIEAARQELVKAKDSPAQIAVEEGAKEGDPKADESKEEKSPQIPPTQEVDDEDAGAEDKSAKVTPAGVMQKWVTSDGQSFEKKAEAVAHEEKLAKAEPTEAEKLRARLEKAVNPPVETDEVPLMEDFDRLAKVFNALSTPFEDGQPKLEKGMYTVNRFSSVLSDLASLSRYIKSEGQDEGGDESDATVAADIRKAVGDLAESFKDYVEQQVTELLAGIDDEVCVSYHDYYYCAAQENGQDQLAKDVCELINTYREPAAERRETLAKAFGTVETQELGDQLSPPMQKRFDDLQKAHDEFKKLAEDAVGQIETLTKRVEAVENTPLPRAPSNVIPKDGDNFAKLAATTDPQERMSLIHDMVKTMGPDAMAQLMIKASHASGGRQLSLKS